MALPAESTLAQHPFLAGLESRHLRQLAELASQKRFGAHEVMFHEGNPADEFYLICRGKVGIETALFGCADIVVETLAPGDVVGWSWLLPPYQFHYSARAMEPTEVIALNGKALRARCDQDPALGYQIMKRFSLVILQRLVATRERFLRPPDAAPVEHVPEPWPFHTTGD
jgi:CRP-like cAMP-binding protein